MKKSIRLRVLLPLVLSLLVAESGIAILAGTQSWNAVLIPASLNKDMTVKLVGGQTQMLTLALQAADSIRKQNGEHDIRLEWDFPQAMRLVSNDGVFQQLSYEILQSRGRNSISYTFRINSSNILGAPGERIRTDWQHQSFFVDVPAAVSEENAYIALRLVDGDRVDHWRWPLRVTPFNPTKAHPKITTVGLWDYGFYRAGAASDGIARFFREVGINFTQRASDKPFFDALKKRNILTGGYTHHSAFAAPETLNSRTNGDVLPKNFPCPQASLEIPPKLPVAGVDQLAKNALHGHGMAVIDFEPTGMDGFCDKAVKKFKEEYKIGSSEFDAFRRYFSSNKFQTYTAKDPELSAIYAKWQHFNSQQTSDYIKQIRESLRKDDPGIRFGVTTGRSYGSNPQSVAALGNDNSLMAANVDVIMPQLYFGYNDANAKLLMRYTQGWRQTLDNRDVKAQLWPLLLIRYPGLNEGQPPLRLRQQVLGALASGARGVIVYAPHNLEADHWSALADTVKDIAEYESFYQRGRRVDEDFKLLDMPKKQAVQNVWPDYKEIIDGANWAFTAHQWNDEYLLSFFNLDDKNDLDFTIDSSRKLNLIKSSGAAQKADFKWTVPAGQIGFVVFSKP